MALTQQAGPVATDLMVGLQGSLFGSGAVAANPITQPFEALDSRSTALFQPSWVQGSDTVFESLRDEMPWRSMERPMYDRVVPVPRLICTVAPYDLERTHPLAVITGAIESALNMSFSSVGLNYYRTGDDSVAWHRDSIGKTGVPATVALVSVGSPRTLALRPYRPTDRQTASRTAETTRSTPATARRWRLGHGDLFVMSGQAQRRWEHSVPKERGVGPRISLAFRSKEAVEGP